MPLGASLAERCRSALLVCREGAFVCGPTAAELHGMPLPPRARARARAELDIGTPGPGRAVRRRGVRGRSLRLHEEDVVDRGGVPVTSVARTWCDLAVILSVPELVAAADWAVRARAASTAALRSAVERYPDHRQRAKLDVAHSLIDGASESPKESELRAIVVLGGLPRPAVNPVVFDHGRLVARVDLLFRDFAEVLEYQGDHHRTDLVQWRRDRTRESDLESLGFHVMEITNSDLRRPRRLVERIVRNLHRRGWHGRPSFSPWFPAD
ncbi:hypothetical protein J2X63_001293 [Agromyces sp. 3263]|uniref:hypothetical protein n=1 Tax=Agromyces sp. 3263 TaxID=2817750 RepID=UPI002861C37E|nr:hypothetical protein [Agromyces sp. 3263]MDR6905607.1 hypothetical protein [Agromyces sp. 3263]